MIELQTYNEAQIREAALADNITHFATGSAVFEEQLLLILRRTDTEDHFLPGYWELPGGSVEPGETILEGQDRELYEETTLRRRVLHGIFEGFDYMSPGGIAVRQVNFLQGVARSRIVLRPREHDAYRWVREEDITSMKITPESRQSMLSAFALGNALFN